VTNIRYMFEDAAAFNQNLCAWGSRLPSTADVSEMFLKRQATSCPTQSNPNLSSNPPGPFCHVCV